MNRGEEGGLRFESGVCSCVSCSETFTGPGGVTELVIPQLRYENTGKNSDGEYSAQVSQREHFDTWSSDSVLSYEDFKEKPHSVAMEEAIFRYLQKRTERSDWLLDAACGPGDFALRMAEAGHYVAGFDISRESILQAMRKAEERGLSDRVCFFVADLHEPPVCENSWDCVLTIGALHHVPDPKQSCIRIQSALRPGGFHFFSENNKSFVRPVFDLMMKLWPLWHEEAGSHSLISEQDIIDWHRGMGVETDFFYSMFVPPHLEKLVGRNLKSLVSVTDKVFGQMPWVCRLGGFISGSVRKIC